MRKFFNLKLIDIFFTIIFIELFIGGSGRVFTYHHVTLRMVLFSLALLWFFIHFLQKRKIGKAELLLSICFLVIIAFNSILGLLHNASLNSIFPDVKQQIIFFSIFYFSLYINSEEKIERIVRLIKYSSLFLSIGYLITIILIHLKIIAFELYFMIF